MKQWKRLLSLCACLISGGYFFMSLSSFETPDLPGGKRIMPGVQRQMEAVSERFDFAPGEANEVFPGPPIAVSQTFRRNLDKAKLLSQLFQTEYLVCLETRDDVVLADLQDAVYLDNYWFVVDRDGDQVHQFDRHGKWVRAVGAKGAGPGEYQVAGYLARVWGGSHLGILDAFNSKILVYDSNGHFIVSSPRTGPGMDGLYVGGEAFIWEQPDRLIFPSVLSLDGQDPWHAVFDVTLPAPASTNTSAEVTLLHGFGRRFHDYFARTGVTMGFSAFKLIDGRIWTGSPFSTKLEVFNQAGQLLAELEPSCTGCATEEDFRGTPDDELRRAGVEFLWKGVNSDIDVVDDMVFVDHGNKGVVVYDINGQLVSDRHLLFDLGRPFLDNFGPLVATPYRFKGLASINEQERMMLEDGGFDYADPDNNNPVLLISSLRK